MKTARYFEVKREIGLAMIVDYEKKVAMLEAELINNKGNVEGWRKMIEKLDEKENRFLIESLTGSIKQYLQRQEEIEAEIEILGNVIAAREQWTASR